MIKKTYFCFFILTAVSIISCSTAKSQVNNDLSEMGAPQGTTELVEKTMIYKYSTNEIKPRSTSTFTFNKDGNFLTHVQTFPEGEKNSQEYSYDDQGRITKIIHNSTRTDGATITRYTYAGSNPLTITATVENGQNYVPKIIQYFDGKKKIKEEIFNNEGVLRERMELDGDTRTNTSFTNSGELSYKRVSQLKDGQEVMKTNYNSEGMVKSGVENELDDYGNMTRSWTLDKDLKRDRESFGYYYTYKNDAWVLRIGREIRDYGSGLVANIKVREVKGAIEASISDDQIKKELQKIKS